MALVQKKMNFSEFFLEEVVFKHDKLLRDHFIEEIKLDLIINKIKF